MEVYVNSSSPIKHKIFWRGLPWSAEADSLPVVYIYDITGDPTINPPIDPDVLLTTVVSEQLDTDFGTYQIYLPYYLTDRQKKLRLVWTYEIDGEEISKSEYVYVVIPYTDMTRASEILGIGFDPSDNNYKSSDELRMAEKYARTIIEKHTDQKFYLYQDSYTVYGSGSDTLILPQKINRLDSLYANDILLVDNLLNIDNWNYVVEFVGSGFGLRINRAAMMDNTVYTANGMVPPSIHDSNGVFQNQVQYSVSGQFGYHEVPDEVDMACIELMKDYFSKDKTWRNKYMKSISTFDWQFEYDYGAYSGTGNLYVDKLLDPFVLTQIMVI